MIGTTRRTAALLALAGVLSTLFALGAPVAAGDLPTNFRRTLVGTIDGKYAIEMHLYRRGSGLHGDYSYAKQGKLGSPLWLQGQIDATGALTIDESDDNGETGKFAGKLSLGPKGEIVMSGTWTKKGATASMPFELAEQIPEIGGGARLFTRDLFEEDSKLKYTIDASIPSIEGGSLPNAGKFNALVRSNVDKDIAAFKAEVVAPEPEMAGLASDLSIGYMVGYAGNGLVSLSFSNEQYMAGAAHGATVSYGVTYDLTAGKEIGLADLFKKGSKYLDVISKFAIAELDKRGVGDAEWRRSGAAPEADNYKSWVLTPEGLSIMFDQYQVASYAEGPQQVLVPYSALASITDPAGPLSRVGK